MPNSIHDKITKLAEAPGATFAGNVKANATGTSVSRQYSIDDAYRWFNFSSGSGLIPYDSYASFSNWLRNSPYHGSLTITKRLVLEALPGLSSWANNRRSVEFSAGTVPDNKSPGGLRLLSAKEMITIENAIRADIRSVDIDYFFVNLLLTGFAVISTGLDDCGFVPCSKDVNLDYDNYEYVCMIRKIQAYKLRESLIKNGYMYLSKDDTRTPAHEVPLMEYIKDSEDDIEIKHGEYEVQIQGDTGYMEFIKFGSHILIKPNMERSIQSQVWMPNPETREPEGVYQRVHELELKHSALHDAINSRIYRASSEDIAVREGMYSTDEINNMHRSPSGDRIEEADKPASDVNINADIRRDIMPMPSKSADIQVHEEELNNLLTEARAATGIYIKPNLTPIPGQQTATEAMMAYEQATMTERQLIDGFAPLYAAVIKSLATRDHKALVQVEMAMNPTAWEKRMSVSRELLPLVIQAIADDPSGAKYGGMINAANTLQGLIRDFVRDGNLPPEYLGAPIETALDTPQGMQAAQATLEEAANKEAEANQMTAQARLLDVQNNASEITLRRSEHIDKTLLALADDNTLNFVNDTNKAKINDVLSDVLDSYKAAISARDKTKASATQKKTTMLNKPENEGNKPNENA